MNLRSTLVVSATIAVIALLGYGLLSKGNSGIALGDPAPATSLSVLDGKGRRSIADYRGKWVMVNFWASWCQPCREESADIQSFYKSHAGDNFTVVGIDTRDLTDDGRAFIRRYGLTYPQLRDGDGGQAREFGTTGVPESFLFDRSGKLRLKQAGPVDAKYLKDNIAPLISGSGSEAQ